MPNIIVYIELRDGEPTAPVLAALGVARAVSRELGATVHAFLPAPPSNEAALDMLARRLGTAGADKVLLVQSAAFSRPALDATHGRALLAAATKIPPLLVVLPPGPVGPELGPPLAARLGAVWAPAVDLDVGSGGVTLRRLRAARDGTRHLDPIEAERPVVVTVAARVPGLPPGADEAEVEVLSVPLDGPDVREIASEPDPDAALDVASAIVVLGAGFGEIPERALRDIAPAGAAIVRLSDRALGALETASPTWAALLGVAPNVVGVTPGARVICWPVETP